MKNKQYFVDEVCGALVIIGLFVKDAPYILDYTHGTVLRDALGMALAAGTNNVAKRLVADKEKRDEAELGGALPCPKCGGTVGHCINCPDGIAFSYPKEE